MWRILPSLPEPDQLADGFFQLHLGVRCVELIKGDGFAAEGHEASFARGAQPFGSGVRHPIPLRASHAPFGGHDDLFVHSVPCEGIVDQALVVADVRIVQAIDICGIDEVAARFDERVNDVIRHQPRSVGRL